jgi:hypothetical protein
LSHPTPKGISEELARLPPFQRTAAENNFIGICVKCNLSLSLVHTRDNDKVVLSCHAEGYSRYVSIATSLAQYPEIRIAKRGQAITVFGVITGIESSGPQVEAHRLEFE